MTNHMYYPPLTGGGSPATTASTPEALTESALLGFLYLIAFKIRAG